jgi:hypothetical protein
MNPPAPATETAPPDTPRKAPPVSTTLLTPTTHPTPTEQRAVVLLAQAAEQIERCGWWQGDLWPDAADLLPYVTADPCCVLGALAVACGLWHYDQVTDLFGRPDYVLAVEALITQINTGRPESEHVRDIYTWNDNPDRTVGEVISTLRTAAHRLDNTWPGGPSAKTFHQAGSPNHQIASQEIHHV